MGRRKLEITKEQIIEARTGRTLSEAAKYLGIGRTTLSNRIQEFGIGEGRGKYDREYTRRKKRSIVHRKLVEHSGEKLPADVGGLASILGLTPENVRSYLERGRRSTERFFRETLTKVPPWVILEDVSGIKYPVGSFKKVRVIMDKWGRNVHMDVQLKNGSGTGFHFNVNKLWNNLEEQVANTE